MTAEESSAGKIFLLGNDEALTPLQEEAYSAEAILQRLLARYPDLLAGEQVTPSAPRRWLLISREVGVPGEEDGGSRWSLDHLFVDQDGIPTLVEVKRSANAQIRREVVGQLLDYAANGSVYWSIEQVVAAFRRRCEREGVEPETLMSEFLGDESDAEVFWEQVKTNLQAGKIRMVFVADVIPRELRRIIEFLNEQMDPAEVLGVEVRQYVGRDNKVLVPKVVGLTAQAETVRVVRAARRWDRDSFLTSLESSRNSAEAAAARRILDWCAERGMQLKWGTGPERGSCSPKLTRGGVTYNLMSLWTDGGIQIQFNSMRNPPFDSLEWRREFALRLATIDESIVFTDDQLLERWPTVRLHRLVEDEGVERFLEAWTWYLDQIPDR
jgi:hypothetical protein